MGKLVGYLLVSLIDALLPPVVIVSVVVLCVRVEWLESIAPYLLVLAGVSFVAAFVAAFVCVLRGSKPFVVTRGAVRAADRVLLWV